MCKCFYKHLTILDMEISVTNSLIHLKMSALLSSVECLLIGPVKNNK